MLCYYRDVTDVSVVCSVICFSERIQKEVPLRRAVMFQALMELIQT